MEIFGNGPKIRAFELIGMIFHIFVTLKNIP